MDAKPADHHHHNHNHNHRHHRKSSSKRDVRYAECQLRNLNTKIDKLLNKLDEKEQDEAKTPEEECVICVNSKATMQTWPCGHRVVCRKCLVRTIQMAVSRRSLPLRCVVCRARVLRLKRSSEARAAAPSAGGGHRDEVDAAAAANTAAAATTARSHSLPIKLRRHATAVAVRSRSVGTGKTGGGRSRGSAGAGCGERRPQNFAGWADVFATDEDDGDDGDDDDDDHHLHDHDDHEDDDDDDDDDDDEDDRRTTSVKYRKLDSTDRRHDNQSKNGLQRILGKLKFWRYLRVKNNKP